MRSLSPSLLSSIISEIGPSPISKNESFPLYCMHSRRVCLSTVLMSLASLIPSNDACYGARGSFEVTKAVMAHIMFVSCSNLYKKRLPEP
jgi:hypothetical protein